MSATARRVPWFLWPFWALWQLIATILSVTGRLVGVILGLVCLIVGTLLTITVVGAILGIPLLILGILLLVRGLF